ncbi:MAG: anaerobic ribonucleoside-triphosphate reductase activating protein [Bacilli bacterium]|jgi:pyruvate formate lyase activating enzyme|nr:anaerobic ribonucleoside-triphosphate reductase activating protein [Bacilli bacterium]
MLIDGFQKVTLLDYPNKVACLLFTRGCNFACPFCQNGGLISCDKREGVFSEDEIFAYLEKRKNILDGVVVSGGEPLLQKDLKSFLKKVKALGLQIKLDTNGSRPKKLRELIEESLVDYVAMDIKNIFFKYRMTAGRETLLSNIEESIALLKEHKVDYEFRTTIVKEYHTLNDLEAICSMIGSKSKYYLQNFVDSDQVLQKNLHGFSDQELKNINQMLKTHFPNVKVRA